MKNRYEIRFAVVLFTCIGCLFYACNDEWKDHYKNGDGNVVETTLFEALKQDAEMSKFVKMIEVSQLTNQINGYEAYTIWAPDNNALQDISLDNLSAEDSVKIQMITQNYIARYFHSTSEIESSEKRVSMLNGKYIVFNKQNENYYFGEQPIVSRNTVCSNGVLHKLNGNVPYLKNLLEYISSSPELSNVYDFISRYDSTYLDLSRSKPIGVNEDGYTIYDSVMIFQNRLLDKIGSIQLEDSVYTFIVPTNQAFQNKYNLYTKYYKSNGGRDGSLNADSVTSQRADSMIVNNLIFRGNYSDLLTKDSLVTTTGTVFKDGRFNMFNGSFDKTSNGDIMLTNNLHQNIFEAVHKPLIRDLWYLPAGIEGFETTLANLSWQFPQENTKVENVVGGFMLMVAAENAANPVLSVYFGKQVVSAKYNVYCTIIPALATDSMTVDECTILDFKLQYREKNKKKTVDLQKGFVTDSVKVEQVLVAQAVEIPYFDAEACLTVTINVPTSQRDKYKRRVRIQDVRLIPVQTY